MAKFIVTFLLLLTIAGCGNKTETDGKISRGIPPLKTVETFRVGQDQPELIFNKTGTVESAIIVNISPQVSGKITTLDVKIGQQVKPGQTLLTLGDSLPINQANLQYQTAALNLELAETSQILTHKLGRNNYFNAKIGIQTSAEAYKKALRSKENAEELFENQQDLADLNLDTAEKAYKTAKKNYNNLADSLDELQDQYSAFQSGSDSNPEILLELEQKINQLKSKLANLKFAKESAENTLEQAELDIEQAQENFETREDELDFAIENAYLGYLAARNQARSIPLSSKLQELGLAQQTLQISSGLESAALTLDQTRLKSPIEGIVTQINGAKNNLVNPGQTVITIENLNTLSIKTSFNKEELEILTPQTEVTIATNEGSIPAKIININPTLDSKSKKINLEIVPTQNNSKLLPGSLVKVKFSTAKSEKIFIPLNSVTLDEGKKLVRVLDDKNNVRLIEIKLGQIIGNFVEATEGLKGNEIIIKSTYPTVEEGERVIPND